MPNETHEACARFALARQQFLDAVTNYVCQPNVSHEVIEAGVLDAIVSLLKDPSLVTQRYAAEVLGRFAEKGVFEAECVLDMNAVQTMLKNLAKRELQFKRTVVYVLASIGRHGDELTKKLIDLGAFEAVQLCLQCPVVDLNTDAMYALRLLGVHPSFATNIIKSELGPLINNCLFSYDIILIQWTLFTVGDIVYESEDLATYLAGEGFLEVMKDEILKPGYSQPVELKMWVLHVWSCFATHSAELAQRVVDVDAIPILLAGLLSDSNDLRDKALYCLIQIAKHNASLTLVVLNVNILDNLLSVADRVSIEQGVMCVDLVGMMASQSVQAATRISEHAIVLAMVAFVKNVESAGVEAGLVSSCIWALGQIGKHSPELANKIANPRTIKAILKIYEDKNQAPELHETCRSTLKLLLNKCTDVNILENLIVDVPEEIQQCVIHRLANLVITNESAKADFLECGGLLKVIYIPASPGTDLMEDILKIVYSYPEPVVRRFRDGPSTNDGVLAAELAADEELRRKSRLSRIRKKSTKVL